MNYQDIISIEPGKRGYASLTERAVNGYYLR